MERMCNSIAIIIAKIIPLEVFVKYYCEIGNKLNKNYKKHEITKQDQIDVYCYGLQANIGSIIKLFLIFSISLMLGVVKPALIIAITFASLRMFAGGFHMKKFSGCMVLSIFMFISTACISQYTFIYWNDMYILFFIGFTLFFALYTTQKYVPKDNPNKKIDSPTEILKFKKYTTLHIVFWCFLNIIFWVLGLKLFIIATCFGVVLEMFTIVPLGFKLFSMLDK